MLASGKPNVYTIEKDGVRKLVYQSPWYEGGAYRGLVEVAVILPFVVPHLGRDGG
jgi:hypothetical protein